MQHEDSNSTRRLIVIRCRLPTRKERMSSRRLSTISQIDSVYMKCDRNPASISVLTSWLVLRFPEEDLLVPVCFVAGTGCGHRSPRYTFKALYFYLNGIGDILIGFVLFFQIFAACSGIFHLSRSPPPEVLTQSCQKLLSTLLD